MLNTQLDYIQDGYIFSDKTLSINLDKFENKQIKKLLIFGPCGSGKSTIGRILSKKYNVPLLETDTMYWKMRQNAAKSGLPRKERKEMIKDVEAKLIKMLSNNKRMIIEGVDWIKIYKKNINLKPLLLKQGMIILGLSALKGAIRAGKRNATYEPDNNRWSETLGMGKINFNILEKTLKQIRNDVKDIAVEYK